MRDVIGWSEGDSILAPGGSISNMYALIIARHKIFPAHKEKGMMALTSQPVCYTSKHSHYSLRGAAATLGLGVDNCREVEVDERGRMCPVHLKKLVLEDREKGLSPFFVNCTSGTTVYRAFDPHKLMGVLLQCSTLHLKENGIL